MGNPTRFLAINLASPEEEFVIHFFEKTGWHQIWNEIISDDAPNDLKYRLEHGPSYALINYDEKAQEYIERPLRLPQVKYRDTRLHGLNKLTRSAFEISEFELILKYASDFQVSGKQMSDHSLHWVLDNLIVDLKSFFSNEASRFDAIVLDYFM